MGLFDRFTSKKTTTYTAASAQHSHLFNALEKMKRYQSPAVMAEFSRVLKNYVDDGTWVPIPTIQDAHGYQPHIIESQGNAYAAMYSDQSEVKGSRNVVTTDINKLLGPVFQNPDISGIIIDPETTSLCMDKGFILTCILHGYLPNVNIPGSPQKNWGIGIPKYSQADLMTEDEMLNFAMHTVLDYEKSLSSLVPVSACDHPAAVPNLIFEDNGSFVFIAVKGYCAKEAPPLNLKVRNMLTDYSKRYRAKCYYAPVCFRSATDQARFDACLALKGDGFYANYEGLEEIV